MQRTRHSDVGVLDGLSKWVVLDYMNEMINGEVNISQMFKPLMKLVDGEK